METKKPTETKTCPACAEEVRRAASICRYCGWDFFTKRRPAAEVPTKNSGLAIASLVLGILFLYGVGSILALIFGYTALNAIDESRGRLQGRGLAIAGIVLGWIGLVLVIGALLFVASL